MILDINQYLEVKSAANKYDHGYRDPNTREFMCETTN